MAEPKLTAVSKRELYFIFGALMLGMLLAALDGTIKSATGPLVDRDSHVSTDGTGARDHDVTFRCRIGVDQVHKNYFGHR